MHNVTINQRLSASGIGMVYQWSCDCGDHGFWGPKYDTVLDLGMRHIEGRVGTLS